MGVGSGHVASGSYPAEHAGQIMESDTRGDTPRLTSQSTSHLAFDSEEVLVLWQAVNLIPNAENAAVRAKIKWFLEHNRGPAVPECSNSAG